MSQAAWQAVIRRTAIGLGVVDPVHGPYDDCTNVKTLSKGIERRIGEKYDIDFIKKKPQSLSRQRAEVAIEEARD
jgi:hypothetical protein